MLVGFVLLVFVVVFLWLLLLLLLLLLLFALRGWLEVGKWGGVPDCLLTTRFAMVMVMVMLVVLVVLLVLVLWPQVSAS